MNLLSFMEGYSAGFGVFMWRCCMCLGVSGDREKAEGAGLCATIEQGCLWLDLQVCE